MTNWQPISRPWPASWTTSRIWWAYLMTRAWEYILTRAWQRIIIRVPWCTQSSSNWQNRIIPT